MKERTVKIEDLVNPGADPRVETETVGLYEITTTSAPVDFALPDPGENIVVVDDPLPRVRAWLNDILTAIDGIRREPERYAESVRATAERCSVPATRLVILLREVDAGGPHSSGLVFQAIEIALELADEFHMLKVNASLEAPVTRYRNSTQTGRANRGRANSGRTEKADEAAREAVRVWGKDPLRAHKYQELPFADVVRDYLTTGRPPRRQADRLRAMLGDGRIK